VIAVLPSIASEEPLLLRIDKPKKKETASAPHYGDGALAGSGSG
jgi:hypothetical protein